jgi:hypothetical protein
MKCGWLMDLEKPAKRDDTGETRLEAAEEGECWIRLYPSMPLSRKGFLFFFRGLLHKCHYELPIKGPLPSKRAEM